MKSDAWLRSHRSRRSITKNYAVSYLATPCHSRILVQSPVRLFSFTRTILPLLPLPFHLSKESFRFVFRKRIAFPLIFLGEEHSFSLPPREENFFFPFLQEKDFSLPCSASRRGSLSSLLQSSSLLEGRFLFLLLDSLLGSSILERLDLNLRKPVASNFEPITVRARV